MFRQTHVSDTGGILCVDPQPHLLRPGTHMGRWSMFGSMDFLGFHILNRLQEVPNCFGFTSRIGEKFHGVDHPVDHAAGAYIWDGRGCACVWPWESDPNRLFSEGWTTHLFFFTAECLVGRRSVFRHHNGDPNTCAEVVYSSPLALKSRIINSASVQIDALWLTMMQDTWQIDRNRIDPNWPMSLPPWNF